MLQWCKYLYNYSQLLYRLYNYSQYFSIHQNHNLILLNNIIESVKKCGSVMIKFCQWITPKLELIYIEENNILNKNKPPWLQSLESLYENCDYHDIQITYDEYEKVFHQKFLEKYKIIDLIGSGSIGQVYLIENNDNKNQFVMKILHPNVKYDISFFRRFYSFLYCFPCFKNKIDKLFPINIHEFINSFEEQSNFINESNNLLKFYNEYKNNEFIIIPTLHQVSESILIMSYENGTPYDEINLNNYQKFKIVNLLNLFIRNNWSITNFNHGDLHKGNWKVKIDNENQNHKLIFYDYGFCFELIKEKYHIVELIVDTFESADKNATSLDVHNLSEIIQHIIIYNNNDIQQLKKKIKNYVESRIKDFDPCSFTPIKLLKLIVNFCVLEGHTINHILLQYFIISIQCQSFLDEFGLKSTQKNEIDSYTVFRERYLDQITFCKTYHIFEDYSKYLENKLNKKQLKVDFVFDTIELPDSIKELALSIN